MFLSWVTGACHLFTPCAGYLMSIQQELESFRKRGYLVRKCPHETGLWGSLWAFSWLMIDDEEPNSLWAVPPLGWRFGWYMIKAKQAMKTKSVRGSLPWPVLQIVPPGSFTIWVPALTPFDDELWYGSVNWNKPFLSLIVYGNEI